MVCEDSRLPTAHRRGDVEEPHAHSIGSALRRRRPRHRKITEESNEPAQSASAGGSNLGNSNVIASVNCN
jgi:hypothetical protein